MPIVGSENIQKNFYRLTITMGGGIVDNVIVTPDGIYSVYFIKDGRYFNATGRIPKIVMDYRCPQNSYMLFDYSYDRSARRERIFFPQVQLIKDVTPNSAYKIAVEHGFNGTVEEWLESMKGEPGKSAYDIAVECGYSGTKEEWLADLKGEPGEPGKSAYDIAVENGFVGTVDEWLAQFGDVSALQRQVNLIEQHVTWVVGMEVPEATALKESLSNPTGTKVTKITRA